MVMLAILATLPRGVVVPLMGLAKTGFSGIVLAGLGVRELLRLPPDDGVALAEARLRGVAGESTLQNCIEKFLNNLK